jgi:hypothetical protein
MKLLALLAMAVLLSVVACNALAQQCSDIANVDFRNSKVTVPQEGEYRFRNGVFDELERPSGLVDWHFEIVSDKIVRPDPHTAVRLIQISGDHVRGTGTHNSVIGFRCSDGFVKDIFQQTGEGLAIQSASSEGLQLRVPVWKKGDGHCCPSAEKDTWFTWNAHSGTYVETRSKETSRH